jgi:DNA-binding MarR family transcriptional regulator
MQLAKRQIALDNRLHNGEMWWRVVVHKSHYGSDNILRAHLFMSDHFNARPRMSAAVIATPAARLQELETLARECGCLLRQFGEECDFLLVARSSETEPDVHVWSDIANYLDIYDTEALVWSDLDAIDAAYAALPAGRCHFFIDTADWQAVAILSGIGRRLQRYKVHEGGQPDETVALHRISSELADFARTLARIAEQEEAGSSSVRDKPVGFRPAPQGLLDNMVKAKARPRNIRAMIKLRRMRDRFFDPALFADPGWDILLDLYAAQDEGKAVSVSSLCIAAAVPPTTALRWITNMTEAGLLIRVQDPGDARRVFIELSPDARQQLETYFEAASAMGGVAI